MPVVAARVSRELAFAANHDSALTARDERFLRRQVEIELDHDADRMARAGGPELERVQAGPSCR